MSASTYSTNHTCKPLRNPTQPPEKCSLWHDEDQGALNQQPTEKIKE